VYMGITWKHFLVFCNTDPLSVYQKGAYCTGTKVFNRLLVPIKQLSHDLKQFKMVLKGFLHHHSFYSLDEYFKYNINYILRLFI
jgi:hypothetical protein